MSVEPEPAVPAAVALPLLESFSNVPLTSVLLTLLLSPVLLVVSVFVSRIFIAIIRYLWLRRTITHLPAYPPKSFFSLPIFEFFTPGGLDRIMENFPRQKDGNFVPMVRFGPHLNGQALISLTDPELLKTVLTNVNDFGKPVFGYEMTKIILGEGLVTSSGLKWKNQRRLVTPIFHFDRLRSMPAVVGKHMEVFVDQMKAQYRANPDYKVVATTVMRSVTMKAIISLAFGDDFDAHWMAEHWHQMNVSFRDYALGHLMMGKIFNYLPIPQSYGPRRIRARMAEQVKRVIIQRREKIALQEANGGAKEDTDADLLTSLLRVRDSESGGQMIPMDEIVDQSLTFLFAGHDTTSGLLSWALYFLCNYPAAKARLHAEIDAVLGRGAAKRRIENDDMEKLPYCRAVLSETLRLRPPTFVLDRETSRDLQLGDTQLPKGVIVHINFYATHHSPKYWPDPFTFKPERWESAEVRNIHPFSYIPFSAGPRNCVGKNFAQREAMIMLATLMQEFDVQQAQDGPHDKVQLQAEVIVEPINFKLRFIPRG